MIVIVESSKGGNRVEPLYFGHLRDIKSPDYGGVLISGVILN